MTRDYPLPRIRKFAVGVVPTNAYAWAVGSYSKGAFTVRRIVWGRLLARAERRDGEQIVQAFIVVDGKGKR